MKIKFITKERKIENLKKWHKKFILFPHEVAEGELQFLTYVARRLSPSYCKGMAKFMQYEYKDIQDYITEKLMDK